MRCIFPEIIEITPRVFGDLRGWFIEPYNQAVFAELGIDATFVQDNQSLSKRLGTVRGLHYQLAPRAQAKLVRVLAGDILDVVVDIRRGSPTFGDHMTVTLSAERHNQLFIPRGFAHGFVTLTPDTSVLYKVDDFYAPEYERGLLWNDPEIGVDWPLPPDGPTLSAKDTVSPPLAGQVDLPEYSS